MMDSPKQIEDVLNNVVYSLFARCAGGAGRDDANARIGNLQVFDHPGAVDVIAKQPDLFRKNFSLISALGYSRFNTNDEEWAVRRAVTQQQYLAAARSSQRAPVSNAYVDRLDGCDATVRGIQDALFSASLGIFYAAFGLAPDTAPTVALLDRVRDVLRRLQFYSWVAPTVEERETAVSDARAVVRDFGSVLGADSRAARELDRFSQEALAVPGFSPIEEFVMNLFAGVETTVATVSWVIDRLAANAEVQERIRSEIVAGGTETPFLDCFVNETMRFFPPIPFLVREAGRDTVVDGRSLRAGQLIMLSIVGVHHHPAFWEDSETFDSRRREFLEDSYDRRAFIPFLTGPRMCGGARLGRLEVKEAVRAVVPRFDFSRGDNVVRFDYALALRPASGSSVRVARR